MFCGKAAEYVYHCDAHVAVSRSRTTRASSPGQQRRCATRCRTGRAIWLEERGGVGCREGRERDHRARDLRGCAVEAEHLSRVEERRRRSPPARTVGDGADAAMRIWAFRSNRSALPLAV